MKNIIVPKSLTHIAVLPATLVTAPKILTCKTLRISVVMLAKKRLPNKANIVKTAKDASPKKTEATKMLEQIKTVIMNGAPIRLANMEASVCSFHVMGNQ